VANIPGAVTAPGRQPKQRSFLEALLLGSVGSLPSVGLDIAQFLREGNRREATETGALRALESLVRDGVIDPELAKSIGVTFTPGLEATPFAQQPGPQVQPGAPTAPNIGTGPASAQPGIGLAGAPPAPAQQGQIGGGGPSNFDFSGIDPRNAPEILEQLLGTQTSVSAIEAAEAQTAESKGRELRAATAFPLEQRVRQATLNAENARTQREQQEFKHNSALSPILIERAELERERERIEVDTLPALREAELREINSRIKDADRRFELQINREAIGIRDANKASRLNLAAQLIRDKQINGYTNAQANTIATVLTYGTFRAPADGGLAAAREMLLTGASPTEMLASQLAAGLGIDEADVAEINRRMSNDGDAQTVFESFRGKVPPEDLGKIAAYLLITEDQQVDTTVGEGINIWGAFQSILDLAGSALEEGIDVRDVLRTINDPAGIAGAPGATIPGINIPGLPQGAGGGLLAPSIQIGGPKPRVPHRR
jgi:hypothetical protein